jgi:hypothetical protein
VGARPNWRRRVALAIPGFAYWALVAGLYGQARTSSAVSAVFEGLQSVVPGLALGALERVWPRIERGPTSSAVLVLAFVTTGWALPLPLVVLDVAALAVVAPWPLSGAAALRLCMELVSWFQRRRASRVCPVLLAAGAGCVLHLAWAALAQVLFQRVEWLGWGPLRSVLPNPTSVKLSSVLLVASSWFAQIQLRWPLPVVVALNALLASALYWLG